MKCCVMDLRPGDTMLTSVTSPMGFEDVVLRDVVSVDGDYVEFTTPWPYERKVSVSFASHRSVVEVLR